MQFSIVSLRKVLEDNEIFRFDADYFHPRVLNLIDRIKAKRFLRIEDCFEVTKLAGFEYTQYFTEQNLASEESYIVLTSKNIQNEELNLSEYMTISKNVADAFLTNLRE